MLVSPRFSSLQQWLEWQETLHPSVIDLGLERVARVADRLGCRTPAPVVISVAGTNGKGSCVALLEAILLRAGYRVGAYTSPHLYRYNERVRLVGWAVSDQTLCDLFARVDAAREGDTLTYFEFGTLAALDLMSRQDLDVALLEVGLGGRLDAVNIVDADVALITSIGIDHTDWLGPDRDSIAREKAGIARAGKPVVCGESEPPAKLEVEIARLGADLIQFKRDFSIAQTGRLWHWQGRTRELRDLPRPALPGLHQLINAASVLSVLETLEPRLRVTREAIEAGLRRVSLPGRVQHVGGPVDQLLDVSHNAQAAQALANVLRRMPAAGHCHLVLGMMRDKDVVSFVEVLRPYVDTWYATGLQVKRASPVETLAASIRAQVSDQPVVTCANMRDTLAALKAVAEPGDRIVVCGSFYTVAEWSALQPQFS
jgi:dihydrofolate synthase/folylpolyglutamate synthase